MSRALPWRVVWGLAAAILLDTLVQIAWKWGADGLPDDAGLQGLAAALKKPVLLAVVALLFLQMFNWLKLLAHAELSFVQPITALSYISVCLLSVLWFGETLGGVQLAGIVCILAGVWFISRSKPTP